MPLLATLFDPAPFIFVVVSNFDHKSLEASVCPATPTFNGQTMLTRVALGNSTRPQCLSDDLG